VALEARLALRQTQRLVMTPMLQQAIQLLQLSTLELQEVLQKELTENPVLEEEPAGEESTTPGDTPGATAEVAPEAPAVTEPADAPELPFDLTEIMFGPREERSLVQQEEHEESRFEDFVSSTPTLADHLEEQLRLSVVDPHLSAIAQEIIGNLDEDGYLSPLVMFERALVVIQGFEPPGVGARHLQDCLLLQLRRGRAVEPLVTKLVEDHPGILREHADLWASSERDAQRIARLAEALLAAAYPDDKPDRPRRERERSRVVAATEVIARLETRPGHRFESPDILARRLAEQLEATPLLPEVRLAAEAIVASLDHDGYLKVALADIADTLPLPGFERALAIVQGFDPPGVGARNLRECLLIQLRGQPDPDPLAVEILEDQFENLQRCRYADIARALKCDQGRVEEAVDEIAALEPKPGRRFAATETRYVVPDVYVHKIDGEYKVVLNDEGIPRLRINSYYRALLAGSPGDDGRRYVEEKMRSAMWLIKSVHQRQRTLYRVTDSIVRFQKNFLDKGLPELRPLSLRDVADDIRMHESTVSRVTTSKYVQTPQGLYELKFFFHSGIATGHGDVVSSISVKKMIQDLVAAENPQKPLSDQEITHDLKQRGLTIARRTVAKYREELGIMPSHQRRLATRRRG
jgi:RNA polymerase sigma-54 factor